jgi:hypothetical protein
MSNWKENLNIMLAMNGCHPVERWNETLFKWCRNWTRVIAESQGMSASVSTTFEGGAKATIIKVRKDGLCVTDFLCQLQYKVNESGELSFYMRSVTGMDYHGFILKGNMDNKEQYYLWESDENTEDLIFEEGYIMETITLSFRKYLDFMRGGSLM